MDVQDEPVVLYLAGLGDAGEKDPKMVRKRHARMSCWGLSPFILLVPLRRDGFWWVVQGDEGVHGWLGEFRSSETELLAGLVEALAASRSVVSIAFSAGAYCLTELLALGRPSISAVALGGLHGHGQSDLIDVPKKRQADVLDKWKAYLRRLSHHPGIPGGIFAMHAVNDRWSPQAYALEVLRVIGVQNIERGFPGVRLTLIESGGKRGHQYEDKAIWQPQVLSKLLEAARSPIDATYLARRPEPRMRGSIALDSATVPEASVIHSEETEPGTKVLWLPADGADAITATMHEFHESREEHDGVHAEAGDCAFEEDAGDDFWDDSSVDASSLAGDSNDEADEADVESADEFEDMEVLEDGSSAIFQRPTDDIPSEWRDMSALDVEGLQVEVGCCRDMPDLVPGWALHAADVFKENGFVVLIGALKPTAAAQVLADCRAASKLMVRDKLPAGNRHGGHRYSMGNASSTGSMLHVPSFARHLLDNRATLAVVEAIYGLDKGEQDGISGIDSFKCVSAGGDFVLGREPRFQRMHDDIGGIAVKDNVQIPPPLLSVNFCVQPITGENGPMRLVPGTQLHRGQWDSQPEEPEEWRATRLFPLPVGAAIVRDVRCLHGGSPNFTRETRFLPCVEFASSQFLETPRGRQFVSRESLPRQLFAQLRPLARRRVCKDVIAAGDVSPTFKKK